MWENIKEKLKTLERLKQEIVLKIVTKIFFKLKRLKARKFDWLVIKCLKNVNKVKYRMLRTLIKDTEVINLILYVYVTKKRVRKKSKWKAIFNGNFNYDFRATFD